MIFIGQMNDVTALAGYGLANVVLNVGCLFPAYGINYALETLVSQAHGAHNMQLCGTYLKRAQCFQLTALLPFILVLFLSKPMLLAIG
jgi:Na+-driven multidrug efflux pump